MAKQIDPVCALHGKRWSEHKSGRCLYCCICFRLLTEDDCATDKEGQKWDVCKGSCAIQAGLGETETA